MISDSQPTTITRLSVDPKTLVIAIAFSASCVCIHAMYVAWQQGCHFMLAVSDRLGSYFVIMLATTLGVVALKAYFFPVAFTTRIDQQAVTMKRASCLQAEQVFNRHETLFFYRERRHRGYSFWVCRSRDGTDRTFSSWYMLSADSQFEEAIVFWWGSTYIRDRP